MRRKIRWQSWENPLGGGSEWVWKDGARPRKKSGRRGGDDEATPVRPVVLTEAGWVAADVYGSLEENFRCWVGHTNFVVDRDVVAPAIGKTPGVEAFRVLTPYRFKIAVGHAFRSEDVLDAIERRVDAPGRHHGWKNPLGFALDGVTERNVGLVRESLEAKGPYWGVLVLPNGAIDSFSAADEHDYDDRYDLYEEIIGRVGGLFLVP